MNKRVDSSVRSTAEPEPRFTAKLNDVLTRRQIGSFSDALFSFNHQYRTQIENVAGMDVSKSVTRLVNRLNVYSFDVDGVNGADKNNPDLEVSIASEFRKLAQHFFNAIKTLVEKSVACVDQSLLKLDLAIGSVNRKIDDYKTRAPELMDTAFVQAELGLRRSISDELLAKSRFEQFRYQNQLTHRDPRKVSTFTIKLIGAAAVLLVGSETAINSEIVKEVFENNSSLVFSNAKVFAFAFAVASMIFGGVFIGWFGIRYLVHEKFSRKLFPGVFCILLGTLGIFAMAFYLCLLAAEVERLTSTESEFKAPATLIKAKYESDRQQAINNTNAHFLNLQIAEASGKKSLTIVLAILLSATFAYAGSLQASDIYPGYSAAARALERAQNDRRSIANEGARMITSAQQNIVDGLHRSLHVTEALVIDVESAVMRMKVSVSEAAYVTCVQTEGYQDCLSLYHRCATVPCEDRFNKPVELTEPIVLSEYRAQRVHEAELTGGHTDSIGLSATDQKATADQFTSALTKIRTESEQNLYELNGMLAAKSAAANTQLQRQKMTTIELEKLVSTIEQCAEGYKSKLTTYAFL